jgi:hypothetical protein
MTFHMHHALVSSALLVGLLATAGCQQPTPYCASAHGYYAAEYTLESGNADEPCGQLLGDVLGLNTYYEDKDMRPNLTASSVAIRTTYLDTLVFRLTDYGEPDFSRDAGVQSVGDFASGKPDGQDFCSVPETSRTALSLPEAPEIPDDPETPDEDETVPAQPATTVAMEWSNVRILFTPDAQGTQMTADLHFEQDGCEADYSVVGVFPAVYCSTDEECDDDANGINPSFATRCNVDLGLCVLSKEPPSYQ